MIKRIKAMLAGRREEPGDDDGGVDELHLAAAALLVEAATTDGSFDDDERRAVADLLRAAFDLDAASAEALIEVARRAVDDSAQLYGFTRVVNHGFDSDERVRMIEMLWEVAYADGRLHDFEASLVRRVAGLIHVADRDSGAARKRVLGRLQPAAAAT